MSYRLVFPATSFFRVICNLGSRNSSVGRDWLRAGRPRDRSSNPGRIRLHDVAPMYRDTLTFTNKPKILEIKLLSLHSEFPSLVFTGIQADKSGKLSRMEEGGGGSGRTAISQVAGKQKCVLPSVLCCCEHTSTVTGRCCLYGRSGDVTLEGSSQHAAPQHAVHVRKICPCASLKTRGFPISTKPQSRSGSCGEHKNLLPFCRKSNPRFLGRTAAIPTELSPFLASLVR
jgi:hypothetical protein